MKVTVLMHEKDPPLRIYMLSGLADVWRSQGHEVVEQHGLGRPVDGDLVFLHVDLTVVPDEYLRAVERHPCVANRRLVDISKTRISRNLVHSADEWDGPVIVKTVLNHGGHPERYIRRASPLGRLWNAFGKLSRLNLRFAESLNPHGYPIYSSVKEMPSGVFSNKRLVVERFLPELHNGLYHTRICRLLGDRAICEMGVSSGPVVKIAKDVIPEQIPVHEAILAEKERMGLDYGKIDYVLWEGKPVVLDVNRTPGASGNLDRVRRQMDALGPGLASLLR